jgi:hypothetical protein
MSRLVDILSNSTGLHWVEIGLDNSELASFKLQMWITKSGKRYIDWAQSLGMGFVTFMGGDLWVHNDDTVARCNLYGEQKECVVGIVTNEEPTKVKIFDSLGIHSDGEWKVTEVIIPPTLNYPNGMESKIPSERFKKRNGVWRAEFLRNMKTTHNTLTTAAELRQSVLDALKGEPLTGYHAYMLLTNVNNPDGAQIKLFKVAIEATGLRGQ